MAAETAILYDGKRLIPAPRLSFSRSHRRSGDQSIVGTEHTVTITGELVGCKGWDFSSGDPEFYEGNDYPTDDTPTDCNKFVNLVNMQDKLRELFAVDGDYRWFEVIGCEGLIRKWRGRVVSIDFGEGPWTEVCPYTITLGLQTDEIADEDLHIDHTETWDVQWEEERGGVYSLSHTLSCSSEEFANTENDITDGWEQAKTWITSRLAGSDYIGAAPTTINNDIITNGVGVSLASYTSYDYTVQRQIDEFNGTYSITETWVLAKNPVFRQWSIEFGKPRDDYVSVAISGEFRSFLNRTASTESTPTNGSAALDAFTTWHNAASPYAEAAAFYIVGGGTGTLGSCPVSRSVTKNVESRGDGTQTFGEQSRGVQFSYEFSDSDPDAELSQTVSIQENKIENCEITVSISGEIQGHACTVDETKLGNARTKYATLDCETDADTAYAAYGGTETLTLTSRSYTENETTGAVSFSCEFSDKADELKDEKITIAWACGDLKSDSTTKTTYSVEGTLRGLCDGNIPTAPDPSTYFDCESAACCTLRRRSVTKDEINKVLTYSYEYDDDCGPGLVEVSVTKTNGPEDCNHWTSEVEFSVQGVGCTSADMYANAQTALASMTASDYAYGNSCQTSYRRTENPTRGNIRDAYTFTTECTAILTVTITESYDHNDCEDTKYQVEGEIKGNCFAEGGGVAAAEAVLEENTAAIYAALYGCLSSSSISRTEKTASIRFSYSYLDCENGYEHEQTITTKTDDQDCCTDITISGTIIPYCTPETGESGAVAVGEAAWTAIQATLAATAEVYCTGNTAALRTTSVSRNMKSGQIQYSYGYECCESGVFEGALRESINITKEFPANVVAIVPILGRTCGPIIQDKGTKTVEKCSVAIDLTFTKQCASMTKPSGLEAQVQSIISAAGCCATAYGTYTERDTESWNPRSGKYTRNVTFICECC